MSEILNDSQVQENQLLSNYNFVESDPATIDSVFNLLFENLELGK
jgi:hypothetical protein